MHKTTLEQWALLELVVTHGSFARAAEESHRSQSSVSYNLGLLQERLGVALLQPEGRRAVLTPAGVVLLAQVRPLLKAFHSVEARAVRLQGGVRTRLDLVVDSIFPRARLFDILRHFQQRHPATRIHLTEVLENDTTALADADVMVLTRRQDDTGRGEWLMNVDFIAVAHRDHPLHQQPTPLSEETLARWPLIRITGRDNSPSQTTASDSWSFSTIDAAVDAVMYQVGYGWLPQERIATQLAEGTLRPLPLLYGVKRATPLHLLVKKTLLEPDEQVQTLLTLFTSPHNSPV